MNAMKHFLDTVGDLEQVTYPDVYVEAINILWDFLPEDVLRDVTRQYEDSREVA